MKKVYRLPVYDIVVEIDKKGGTIVSSLKEDNPFHKNHTIDEDEIMHDEFDACMDGIEALILSCACNGINIALPEFVKSVQDAVSAAENHFL
jgi:hypothetical protein